MRTYNVAHVFCGIGRVARWCAQVHASARTDGQRYFLTKRDFGRLGPNFIRNTRSQECPTSGSISLAVGFPCDRLAEVSFCSRRDCKGRFGLGFGCRSCHDESRHKPTKNCCVLHKASAVATQSACGRRPECQSKLKILRQLSFWIRRKCF